MARVLTVRMDPDLYAAIAEVAHANRTSANKVGVTALIAMVAVCPSAAALMVKAHGPNWEQKFRAQCAGNGRSEGLAARIADARAQKGASVLSAEGL